MELIYIISSIFELSIIVFMIFYSKISKEDINTIKSFSTDIRNNYLQTLKNTVYSDNAPLLERLIAFKEYIKSGGNGNCKHFAIKKLILSNKDLWQSVVSNDKLETIQTNKDYYIYALEEINKTLL